MPVDNSPVLLTLASSRIFPYPLNLISVAKIQNIFDITKSFGHLSDEFRSYLSVFLVNIVPFCRIHQLTSTFSRSCGAKAVTLSSETAIHD